MNYAEQEKKSIIRKLKMVGNDLTNDVEAVLRSLLQYKSDQNIQ